MRPQTDITFNKIHPSFKWQGEAKSQTGLKQQAEKYTLSDELHLRHIGHFFQDWFDNKATIEVQTSGSTGTPRRMQVKKQYMVNSALATGSFFGLPAGTTALLCMPASYIAGKLMLVRAMALGWELDSVRPQANPLAVNDKPYDFCALTPYQLKHSFDDLHLIKKIMAGGGAITPSLHNRVQKIPSQIFETYAMTETLTHIAARSVNHLQKGVVKPPFETLHGIDIWQDKRGCLVIKAPQVSDEIIYTNDMIEMQGKTAFWLKGRYDNIINSGGIKIQPEELETKLGKFIHSRFFVTGLTDDALGQKTVLFIEDHYTPEKLLTLQCDIEKSPEIDRYERPKKIYYIAQFEETHTGKINRPKTVQAKLG